MNVFEKIREKFANIHRVVTCDEDLEWNRAVYECETLVNQVEQENNNGWILCSERLPEDKQECLTTEKIYFTPDHVDEDDNYIGVEMNAYSEKYGWLKNPNVIAWQPLPQTYKERDTNGN